MRRYLRGRMFTFLGVIATSAAFEVLVVWWIVRML
jgi:hypothetical protein